MASCCQGQQKQMDDQVAQQGAKVWGPALGRARETLCGSQGGGEVPAVRRHKNKMGAAAADAAAQRRADGNGPSEMQPASGSSWRLQLLAVLCLEGEAV